MKELEWELFYEKSAVRDFADDMDGQFDDWFDSGTTVHFQDYRVIFFDTSGDFRFRIEDQESGDRVIYGNVDDLEYDPDSRKIQGVDFDGDEYELDLKPFTFLCEECESTNVQAVGNSTLECQDCGNEQSKELKDISRHDYDFDQI